MDNAMKGFYIAAAGAGLLATVLGASAVNNLGVLVTGYFESKFCEIEKKLCLLNSIHQEINTPKDSEIFRVFKEEIARMRSELQTLLRKAEEIHAHGLQKLSFQNEATQKALKEMEFRLLDTDTHLRQLIDLSNEKHRPEEINHHHSLHPSHHGSDGRPKLLPPSFFARTQDEKSINSSHYRSSVGSSGDANSSQFASERSYEHERDI
jgi:hypothetical protein